MKMKGEIIISNYSLNDYDIEITQKNIFQTMKYIMRLKTCSKVHLLHKLSVMNKRVHFIAQQHKYKENKSIISKLCNTYNWRNSRYIGSIFDTELKFKKMLFFQLYVNGKICLGCNYYHTGDYNNVIILSKNFFCDFYKHVSENRTESIYSYDDIWY